MTIFDLLPLPPASSISLDKLICVFVCTSYSSRFPFHRGCRSGIRHYSNKWRNGWVVIWLPVSPCVQAVSLFQIFFISAHLTQALTIHSAFSFALINIKLKIPYWHWITTVKKGSSGAERGGPKKQEWGGWLAAVLFQKSSVRGFQQNPPTGFGPFQFFRLLCLRLIPLRSVPRPSGALAHAWKFRPISTAGWAW